MTLFEQDEEAEIAGRKEDWNLWAAKQVLDVNTLNKDGKDGVHSL